MATEFKDILAGVHGFFAREGDAIVSPAAGFCAQEVKPGIDPDFDASWIEIGDVEGYDPNVTQTDIKLYKPSLGHVVLKNLLETKQELTGKLTVNNMSALIFELMFRTSQKLGNGQTQFNALSAVSRRGWLHLEGYDQDEDILFTHDMWVRARASTKFALGEPVKPEIEFFMLYSSLNTGMQPFN